MLTEERKRAGLLQYGYNPDEYDAVENESGTVDIVPKVKASPVLSPSPNNPVTTAEEPTKLGSFARSTAASIIPSLGGLASGALSGAGTGAALGALGANPLTIGIGSVVGGIGGAIAGGWGTAKVQEALLPDSVNQTLARDMEVNPLSSVGGNLAGSLVGLKPDFKAIAGADRALRPFLIADQAAVHPANMGNLLNVGIGAGIGAGQSIYDDKSRGQDIDLGKLAINTLGNAVINNPRKWTTAIGATPNVYPEIISKSPLTINPANQNIGYSEPVGPAIPRSPEEIQQAQLSEIRQRDFLKAKEELKQSEFEVATAGIEQQIKANQLKAQELRAKPLTTLETGEEVIPDYTGNQEFDAQQNLAESADDLAMRRLEGRNDRYQTDEAKPAATKEEILGTSAKPKKVTTAAREAEFPPVVGQEALATKQTTALPFSEISLDRGRATTVEPEAGHTFNPEESQLIRREGLTMRLDPELSNEGKVAFGRADVGTPDRQTTYNPKADHSKLSKGENVAHEAGHHVLGEMLGNPQQAAAAKKWLARYGNDEERLISQVGKAWSRRTYSEGEGFKTFVKDFIASTKARIGRGSEDDVARLMASKLANDIPVSLRNAKLGDSVTPKFNADERDVDADIAKYNEIQKAIEKKLAEGDFESDEFQNLWKANEQLKNKYGGMPPSKYKYQGDSEPTPGTVQSIVKYGHDKDMELGVKAVSEGKKPVYTYYNELGREPKLASNLEIRKITNAKAASHFGDRAIIRKGDIESFNALMRAAGDSEKAAKALGYSEKELEGFFRRIDDIDNLVSQGKSTDEAVAAVNKNISKYQTDDSQDTKRLKQLEDYEDRRNLTIQEEDELAQLRRTARKPFDKMRQEVAKYQTDEDSQPVFKTSTEKLLTESDKLKSFADKNGQFNSSALKGYFNNNIPQTEANVLRDLGFEKFLDSKFKITKEEVAKWLDENAPKVEVHSYGQKGKVSKAKEEYDRMTHEWYDNLNTHQKHELSNAGTVAKMTQNSIVSFEERLRTNLQESEWNINEISKAEKYLNLEEAVRREPRDNSPRATSAYNQVSPKDTKTHPIVRVDVVIPRNFNKKAVTERLKKAGYSEAAITNILAADEYVARTGGQGEAFSPEVERTLWQPDGLHENLPNTLGWAAIQYETLPNGNKVAHIFEVQSRWGQEVRKQKAYDKQVSDDHISSDTKDIDHPLLKDYNRLILKSAIEQARKDGATHIAISDAETAMMSEGHDAHTMKRYNFKDGEWNLPQLKDVDMKEWGFLRSNFKFTGEVIIKDGQIKFKLNDGDTLEAKPQDITGVKGEKDIPHTITYDMPDQEQGMRLNYDKILPKIAEELTGSKGEVVNFGEHKNAFEDKTQARARNEVLPWGEIGYTGERVARPNLSFKNQDGTPKTSVTARLYDISKPAAKRANDEPFSLFGSKYQTEGDDAQINTPEFKKWFGDSKVVDAEGKPLVVYHASKSGDVTEFNPLTHWGTKEQAHSLWDGRLKRGEGSLKSTTPAYISIKNPLRIQDRVNNSILSLLEQTNPDLASQMRKEISEAHKRITDKAELENQKAIKQWEKSKGWLKREKRPEINYEQVTREFQHNRDTLIPAKYKPLFIQDLESRGYDGLIYKNEAESDTGDSQRIDVTKQKDSYVTFRPEQIKSAIGNKGTFDANNPDIRYQTDDVPATKADKPDKFLGIFGSSTDKIRNLGTASAKYVADKLDKFDKQWSTNLGQYRNTLQSRLLDYSEAERANVDKYGREMMQKEKSDIALTDKEQELYDSIRTYLTNVADVNEAREIKKNPNYWPAILSTEVAHEWHNNPMSAKSREYKTAWLNYAKEKRPKMAYDERVKMLNDYIDAIGSRGSNPDQLEFGALRKMAGVGLPENLQDNNLLSRFSRYGDRVAKDLASQQILENDPVMRYALRIKGLDGKSQVEIPTLPDGTKMDENLAGSKQVQNAMKFMYNDFNEINQPRIKAATRLLHSAILGTATGVRDLVQSPMHAVASLNSWKDVKSIFTAIPKMFDKDLWKRSFEINARSKNLQDLEFGAANNPDQISNLLNKASTFMRKWSGREALEQAGRVYQFGVADIVAREKILAAQQGDAKAKDWLTKHGDLIEDLDELLAGNRSYAEGDIDKIAKSFVDRTAGTYSMRGLPAGAMEGSLAPFMSLSRWSLEKTNVIYKDVVQEAYKKGNLMPLLTYTLGSILSGAAIRELNELMSGKKAPDASLKETILSEADGKEKAKAVISLMQMGSYGGMIADIVKAATNPTKARGMSFPLAEFATDTLGRNIANATIAIEQGEDKFEVATQLIEEIIRNTVQTYKMVANQTYNKDEVEQSNKFRDVRTFNELTGDKAPSADYAQPNKFLGKREKEFKKTDNVEEAAEQLNVILKDYFAKYSDNPEKLKSKLAGLKANNYQTMPSPERVPLTFLRYLNYLKATQSDKAAEKAFMDYMLQNNINKVKSRMVPSL